MVSFPPIYGLVNNLYFTDFALGMRFLILSLEDSFGGE